MPSLQPKLPQPASSCLPAVGPALSLRALSLPSPPSHHIWVLGLGPSVTPFSRAPLSLERATPQRIPLHTSRPGSPAGPVRPGGPTGPGGPRSPDAPGAPCLPGSPWGTATRRMRARSEAPPSPSGEGADRGSVQTVRSGGSLGVARPPRAPGEERPPEPGGAQLARRKGRPHSPMGRAGRGILAHHAAPADRRCPSDRPDPGDLEDRRDPEGGEEGGENLRSDTEPPPAPP